jgi:hypothetical protein
MEAITTRPPAQRADVRKMTGWAEGELLLRRVSVRTHYIDQQGLESHMPSSQPT